MRTEDDISYMRLALSEAKKGIGRTSPNPCVGAVIVNNGQVVGKGYHRKAGTPHAEIHALRAAGERAAGATMYVTLEPCNHVGRTPPCSHAVAAAGIVRVVVGMEDPNPLVDGTGVDYLRENGVSVDTGVLEQECREINHPFIKHITCGLPWVVMKAGISLDGRLNYQRGESGWITGAESKQMVHRLRDRHDAIMVGHGTAAIDNPALTTRLVKGRGMNPLRVIIDSDLTLPVDLRAYSGESDGGAMVFCAEDASPKRVREVEGGGVLVERVARNVEGRGLQLDQVFRCLGNRGITSVLVEGGAALHGGILRARLYDYANLFMAPLFAGEGGISLLAGYCATGREGAVAIREPRYRRLGADMMISGHIQYP